jgi:hypothetical protein
MLMCVMETFLHLIYGQVSLIVSMYLYCNVDELISVYEFHMLLDFYALCPILFSLALSYISSSIL